MLSKVLRRTLECTGNFPEFFVQNHLIERTIKKIKNILMIKKVSEGLPDFFMHYLLVALQEYARGVVLCVKDNSCTLSAGILAIAVD